MAESHVITALVAKYRQLAGRLIVCERDAVAIRADLAHLDAAIRMFRADYDTAAIPPKRPYRPNRLFKHGSLSRNAMDVLRKAGVAMTSREIVIAALKEQGVKELDATTLAALRNNLNGTLGRWEKAGIVVSVVVDGEKRWRVVG